jgi:hypothetical protein
MTMINTSTLISASQIVDAVQNYVDWNRLYMNTKLFALMNNLGLVSAQVPTGTDGKGNYRILYNKATGVKTDYTLTGAIADVGGGKIKLLPLKELRFISIRGISQLSLKMLPQEKVLHSG